MTKVWCSAGRRFSAPAAFRLAVLAVALAALLAATGPRTHASVGVVLNESLHESMDRITGTGHTAVYFSNICADSPVKLRLCRSGELGSVMSTYVNIGEDQSYGWNIVPLSIYLYGVEDPAKRPIFASYKVKRLLEERYRDNYLTDYCVTMACRTSLKAEWREMVAVTLIRSIYIFAVDTTLDEDRAMIAGLNDAVNKNNFNGVTRNCADFTKHIINTYFPHAVSRDFLNDFGMTSPKAVARTFTHYALRHPESNFRVMHFAQVTGTIRRSSEVRAGTEQLYRSKKLLVPMVLFAGHELPFAAASYLLTGRFNPEHEFEKYPAAGPSTEDFTPPPMLQAAASLEERQQIVGSSPEWKEYKSELNAIVDGNKAELDRHDLSHFLKQLERTGAASVDSDGSVWMEVVEDREPLKVGVSANNALAHGSNPHLSYKFLLARTAGVLKSPKHSRETMLEFRQDWDSLQRASSEISSDAAIARAAPKNPATVPVAIITSPNF